MLKRFFMVIRSWFGAGLDKLEDPAILLQQAQEEMNAAHAKNRERAVQAITQKNNLQNEVDRMQKQVDTLQMRAEQALKRGDRDLALQVLKEKESYSQSLQLSKTQLEQAIATAEQVKEAIRREEMKIREKAAQAMALQATHRNNQIQKEMERTLQGMEGINTDSLFAKAEQKIRNSTSEVGAIRELGANNIQTKLDQLDSIDHNEAAEAELAALESKLGLSSTPVAQTTVKPVETDIERQLAELEARVGGGSGS